MDKYWRFEFPIDKFILPPGLAHKAIPVKANKPRRTLFKMGKMAVQSGGKLKYITLVADFITNNVYPDRQTYRKTILANLKDKGSEFFKEIERVRTSKGLADKLGKEITLSDLLHFFLERGDTKRHSRTHATDTIQKLKENEKKSPEEIQKDIAELAKTITPTASKTKKSRKSEMILTDTALTLT